MEMQDGDIDPQAREAAEKIQRLLDAAGEPESDDPTQWTPPEVIGLALMYAYGVDALPNRGAEGWLDTEQPCDDVLFNRDLLQEWLDEFGEDALEDLVEAEIPDLPLPSEVDLRLHGLYVENRDVREFLESEYVQFRAEVDPPRSHRWWWLDAELFGKLIH